MPSPHFFQPFIINKCEHSAAIQANGALDRNAFAGSWLKDSHSAQSQVGVIELVMAAIYALNCVPHRICPSWLNHYLSGSKSNVRFFYSWRAAGGVPRSLVVEVKKAGKEIKVKQFYATSGFFTPC
jgi:hypothetical protein